MRAILAPVMEKESYILTVGLEVHAELATASKMWCGCNNDPEEKRPNVNICPVCTAQPGSLPVANLEAVRKVIQVGLALDGTISDFGEFDRKNYFYPDIPKGYQISQYKYPIVSGGSLNNVAITRVHLEEDTARSTHDKGNDTLVDFNRAGVPLMELVTEPVIHDAKTAGDFARELQLLLKTLGVSGANMEKGQMRVEANISVSKDPKVFGTKVEVKNINSFRAVERAIAYEMNRHIEMLEKGEPIKQETRGWDENKGITFSQRSKENAQDYRYFPDPDLPKLYLHEYFNLDAMRQALPELPEKKRRRYEDTLGLRKETASLLTSEPALASYFEKVIVGMPKETVQMAANYLGVDFVGLLNKEGRTVDEGPLPEPRFITELMELTASGLLSSRTSKDLLALLVSGELTDSPKLHAEKFGLLQKNDEGALLEIVQGVVAQNPDAVSEFKQGKDAIVMFLVGQCMKAAKGSGNPGIFQKLIREELSK
jgi:aspartyl-tRNA(Asn)/glutamyl-tRNA(Gln) amidotransferase subunit B